MGVIIVLSILAVVTVIGIAVIVWRTTSASSKLWGKDAVVDIETARFIYEVRALLLNIPDDQWTVDTRNDGYGKRCALGHLDKHNPEWTRRIIQLTTRKGEYRSCDLVLANNGNTYQHLSSPKERSIAFLNDFEKTLYGI